MGEPVFDLRSWIAGRMMKLAYWLLRKAGEMFMHIGADGDAQVIEIALQEMWDVGLDTRSIAGGTFPERIMH